MASNIISDTIDATYPVAGVDNDTQGFRDNFSIIKTGLSTAGSEISRRCWSVILGVKRPLVVEVISKAAEASGESVPIPT